MENKNPYDIIDFEDITSDSAKEIILTELKEYDDDELVRQRHMANYNKNSLRLNLIDFEIQRRTDERFEKDKEFIEEQNKYNK